MTGALRLTAVALAAAGMSSGRVPGQESFSEAERRSVLAFWASPGRYSAAPAGAAGSEWCVRLTPAGSTWIREVYRLFTPTKVVPTMDPAGNTAQQEAWVAWIDRAVQRDWAVAEKKASDLNRGQGDGQKPSTSRPKTTPAVLDRRQGVDTVGRQVDFEQPAAVADPCPGELVALVGEPPRFAAPVRPFRHTVAFPGHPKLTYVDNVKVRPKYAYYRFPDGVSSGGTSVKSLNSKTLDRLFRSAGLTKTELAVMRAVSVKEGGFDSVNTYDTGLVSVGFIQFACLGEGSGSLGKMLCEYRLSKPDQFHRDFRSYGLDVDERGRLVALDLQTGEEKVGADAAMQVIRDKRLIAVFQRAGQVSHDFRVAQIQAAKRQFYPADDLLVVRLDGASHTVRVGDVFRSEAGLATLMDRKVNTGKLGGLQEHLERLGAEFGLQQPAELRDLEFMVTRAMTYREDYLLSATLSQPRNNVLELSRRGTRSGRGGGGR